LEWAKKKKEGVAEVEIKRGGKKKKKKKEGEFLERLHLPPNRAEEKKKRRRKLEPVPSMGRKPEREKLLNSFHPGTKKKEKRKGKEGISGRWGNKKEERKRKSLPSCHGKKKRGRSGRLTKKREKRKGKVSELQ